jgi:hypothetical protein
MHTGGGERGAPDVSPQNTLKNLVIKMLYKLKHENKEPHPLRFSNNLRYTLKRI